MSIDIAARRRTRRKRPKGSIDRLPSGAFRVRVYVGVDPVTGKRYDLTEVVDSGPNAERKAEKVLRRLLNQVDEHQHPKTAATINQLLDKHLEMLHVEESTRRTYRRYIDKHIRPLIGKQKVGRVDATILDSLYAELLRCRAHCRSKRYLDHRTTRAHQCDARCQPHTCKPLAPWTVRKIHFILSGAYDRAVRWQWVSANPCEQAAPPPAPVPDPQPPSPEDAARILNGAWADLDFGTFVWTVMTTSPPKTASQRYNRLAERLGIETTLHRLRPYSATELIAAGVDIRTVAGRLGHSGGGTTTLKVYAAWQRASQTLLSRVPQRPAPPLHPAERAKTNPQSPYEKIAAQLRLEILDGTRKPGEFAPTVKELQAANNVGAGTAHRAIGLLKTWGLVEASRGRRATILEPPPSEESTAGTATATNAPAASEHPNATSAVLLELRLLHLGEEARRFTAEADPQDPAQLRRLLSAAARRSGGTDVDLTDYELEVRRVGDAKLVTSFAVL